MRFWTAHRGAKVDCRPQQRVLRFSTAQRGAKVYCRPQQRGLLSLLSTAATWLTERFVVVQRVLSSPVGDRIRIR